MARCTFCRENIAPGTGTMLVKNDGKIILLCSSKCERNMDKGREPRKLRWTLAHTREKRLAEKARGTKEEKGKPAATEKPAAEKLETPAAA